MSQSYTSMRDYAPSSSNTNSHFQISVYNETEKKKKKKKNTSKTVMFTQPIDTKLKIIIIIAHENSVHKGVNLIPNE